MQHQADHRACGTNPAYDEAVCSRCGARFAPTHAFQVAAGASSTQYYCSETCRPTAPRLAPDNGRGMQALAVLNQKGGTAKTTTAIGIAAGFAARGYRTLLIDLDPQGSVAASLGLSAMHTVESLLLMRSPLSGCALCVRPNLDVVVSTEALATVEGKLARQDPKQRIMRLSQALAGVHHRYDKIVLDCAPAISCLNHNALYFAGEVLIPVSCDYLALVGVKQVLRTLRRVHEESGRRVRICGVVPTFYDVRKRLCLEALQHLKRTFGSRTLPPVRINARLAEAPSQKRTIYEHAPDSHGARDYVRVVEWLCARSEEPTALHHVDKMKPFGDTRSTHMASATTFPSLGHYG